MLARLVSRGAGARGESEDNGAFIVKANIESMMTSDSISGLYVGGGVKPEFMEYILIYPNCSMPPPTQNRMLSGRNNVKLRCEQLVQPAGKEESLFAQATILQEQSLKTTDAPRSACYSSASPCSAEEEHEFHKEILALQNSNIE